MDSARPYYEVEVDNYSALLEEKVLKIRERFATHLVGEIELEVFPQKSPTGFRNRLRYMLGTNSDEGDDDDDERPPYRYCTFDSDGKITPLRHPPNDPIAAPRISNALPVILDFLVECAGTPEHDAITKGLRCARFLTNEAGSELVVVLCYVGRGKGSASDLAKDDLFEVAAAMLRARLGVGAHVIGRSKGSCVMIDKDWVTERICGASYKHVEGTFSNPSSYMASKTLEWISSVACGGGVGGDRKSLVELYSGGGNHTVVLARDYHHVVSVEISPALCDAARENLRANGIDNVTVVCDDCDRFCTKLTRPNAGGGIACDFSTIVVDPPRAGLGNVTRRFASRFDEIVYVSCVPDSLLRDLECEEGLASTHRVARMCVLDHFPFTKHIEVAVHLVKKCTTGDGDDHGGDEEKNDGDGSGG